MKNELNPLFAAKTNLISLLQQEGLVRWDPLLIDQDTIPAVVILNVVLVIVVFDAGMLSGD